MTYRMRRRGILCFLLISLIAVVVLMEKSEHIRIRKNGDYMKNFRFVLGNSASEQEIFCFADEEKKVNYLFLPSYARLKDVRISFAGARNVVFAGAKGEVSLVNGEDIGALAYDEKYDVYFVEKTAKNWKNRK